MSPGIAIEHVRLAAREDREIRTDHVGFLGVVPRARWPEGARVGDLIELPVDGPDTFAASPVVGFFDAGTRAAVRAFFANGGEVCTVFGVCVRDEADLTEPSRIAVVFRALLDRLRHDDDLPLLTMPPLAWLPAVHDARGLHVAADPLVRLLLRHCQEMSHRFLVIDAPRDLDEAGLAAWIASLRRDRAIDPAYGALYHPWLVQGETALPPSGAVTGVYARVDRRAQPLGVRAAPANVEIEGFTHPQVDLAWRDAPRLAALGVNPILVQSGRGLVVWGARTLSDDPRWRSIVSRRIVGFVTERLRRDAEWVVFEQMRPELWEAVARMVRSRLDAFWAAGLLTGEQAGSDYAVQCDDELNPPAVRDEGQVHVKVLLRPVTTTEFIEVELQLGA